MMKGSTMSVLFLLSLIEMELIFTIGNIFSSAWLVSTQANMYIYRYIYIYEREKYRRTHL